MNSYRFHDNPCVGLRLRPLALRASLESLDSARDAEPVEARGAKHPVETCNKVFSLFAGSYSRIRRIRELVRLTVLRPEVGKEDNLTD